MGAAVAAPAPAQQGRTATSQSSVAGGGGAEAVVAVLVMAQVNARSQVVRYLTLQRMSSRAPRACATHCLPVRLRALALQPVQMPPVAARPRLPQVVMARIQTRVPQDAIRLQIPRVSQTSRQAAVQMQRSTTKTGSTSRSVSSLAKRLRRWCDPAMPCSLQVQVSAAAARVQVRRRVQKMLISVPVTLTTRCSADSRKV